MGLLVDAVRVRQRALWQLMPVVAWLVLLWGSLVPAVPLLDPRVALCLVTCLAAVGCAARVQLPAERAVWAWMAVGLAGYGLGFVVLFGVSTGEGGGPWGLNVSDCASLLLYPAGYASLVLLTRGRVRSWTTAALLDGGIVALAAAATGVAWAATSYPSLLAGGTLDVVYALAYPVGATTLLVATVTGLAMTRWQLDPVWALLVVGFGVMAVGQAAYGLASATGTFRFGTPLDAVYSAGPVLVCLAAWRRPGTVVRRAGNGSVAMVVPAVATLVALAVLVVDHAHRVPTVAVVLAAAAVVLTIGRTALSWRQERLLVAASRAAQVDELTGLPTRRALLADLTADLSSGSEVTLALLELDGVAEVNDTLGHAAGDAVLLELADRLRVSAGGRVARLGAAEFAVVLGPPQRAVDGPVADLGPEPPCAELRSAVSEVVVVDGCRISVQVSLGLATAGSDAAHRPTAVELLRRAEVARHVATARRSGLEVWRPQLDDGARDRLALLAELRVALVAADQIVVHYQPQVDPTTRRVHAWEALVRWQHPRRGLLAPSDFLQEVERAGLLPGLTSRVLDVVLADQAAARAAQADLRPVSVNVGAADLLDPAFASRTAARLEHHALPPACLRIEITEGVVMAEPERILTTLHELSALGIALSLDDYGTGLSSLSYLRLLPVDELKIDRSFVSRMTQDSASALIVGSRIALAHGLGLLVVAEGVEDEETLQALAAAGCDLVQGYLTGRPAAATPAMTVAQGRRAASLTV